MDDGNDLVGKCYRREDRVGIDFIKVLSPSRTAFGLMEAVTIFFPCIDSSIRTHSISVGQYAVDYIIEDMVEISLRDFNEAKGIMFQVFGEIE